MNSSQFPSALASSRDYWSLFPPPGPTTPASNYPPTRRVDHVDTYFGTKVADPYRWLEADVRHSPEVAAWVKAENKLTESYLAAIPQRETIRRRLTELWNFAQYYALHEGRRPLLLLQERRPAEPARALRDRFARRPSRGC